MQPNEWLRSRPWILGCIAWIAMGTHALRSSAADPAPADANSPPANASPESASQPPPQATTPASDDQTQPANVPTDAQSAQPAATLDLPTGPVENLPLAATPTAPVGADADPVNNVPPVKIDPTSFNGIKPGVSTAADVEKVWGTPLETRQDGEQLILTYAAKPFRYLDIMMDGNLCEAILIHLDQPRAADQLARQLKLDDTRAVEVPDEQGGVLGRVFPERGVLFNYTVDGNRPLVGHVLIEPVDVQTFVLRVENRLLGPCVSNLADLNYTLEVDPSYAYGRWLRGKILLAVGRVESAALDLEAAIQLDPQSSEYRLTWSDALAQRGAYREAIDVLDKLLVQEESLSPAVKARCLVELGDLVGSGPRRDFRRAIDLHQQAIKIAEPLASDANIQMRRDAREILVDAHLGVACDIGWGNWKRKSEVVPKWLQRALALADQTTDDLEGKLELKLRIATAALIAGAGLKQPVDPGPWVEEARETAKQLLALRDDPLWHQRVGWQLGQAYHFAMRAEHDRRAVDRAFRYGQLSLEHLEAAAPGRQQSQAARYLLGQAYFGIGALHAVHRTNHDEAIEWYDKASPLLVPLAGGESRDPVRLGESLVSMGVSYWEAGLRQQGAELTESGAKTIERAVEHHASARSSLAVPYGNLASMYKALGNDSKAKNYSQLANQSLGVQRR